MKRLLALLFALTIPLPGLLAQTLELPAPQKTGGMPLMEALSKRATSRKFDGRELSPQQLANLLWAGFGVSRPDGRRTAPSASNAQENEIYVLLRQGAYVYDATQYRLQPVIAEDLRSLARSEAPVTLLYVADLAKRTSGSVESKKSVACIDSGFISENVYLYCASEGLATGYRGGFDGPVLTAKLNLRPTQQIIAVQPVGFPQF
jgi:nitroreductase